MLEQMATGEVFGWLVQFRKDLNSLYEKLNDIKEIPVRTNEQKHRKQRMMEEMYYIIQAQKAMIDEYQEEADRRKSRAS